MKSVKSIMEEESRLRVEARSCGDKEKKRTLRELEFLKEIRLYLETKPTTEFLKKELERIEKTIDVNGSRFGQWAECRSGSSKDLRRQYDSFCRTGDLKRQKRSIEFLLNE